MLQYRVLWVVLPSLLVSIATGCNNSANVATVTGVVRYKGEPLPGGTLTFFGGADHKTQARTLIGQDGTYRLPNPPQGAVKIAVEGPTPPSGKKSAKPAVLIPANYANPDTSGLTYTVTDSVQIHDIELK
jgi:hypothetical protein